jgi:hypothetical protein
MAADEIHPDDSRKAARRAEHAVFSARNAGIVGASEYHRAVWRTQARSGGKVCHTPAFCTADMQSVDEQWPVPTDWKSIVHGGVVRTLYS